ncbi:restriction endonuclease subunit S [Pseudomonas sp. PGPR81]|uniref:restriction endonuclease subunit S n=1 Tax=Pseudomonas sp. PGPR81 TaxID=2913477 RepID=UPI001EDC0F6C|nr:restriction endonuclease subunit S [Pseudomonas sp. PGPR81]
MSSEYSCLEDVAEIIDSLHKTPSYSTHGFPMVRVTDVKYGNLALAGCHRVDEATYLEFSRRFKPRVGDIVMTRVGTYGVSAIVRETDFCLGQNTVAIVPNGIHPRYLYAALNSAFVREQIEAGVVGSTQKTLSLKNIKALKVPRHGEDSENAIAELIASLDDRIALLRETNATLEAIAQALFKSWFVDFDPVRAKAEGRQPEGMDATTAALFPDSFGDSELGLVPKGWAVGSLGVIAQTARRQIQASELHADVRYVGLEHIPRKSLSLSSWGNADGLESTKSAFSEGDILFGKLRPYFHKVVLAPFSGVCSTDILVCQPKEREYFCVVAMHLFSETLISYADRLSNGAKMPRVNWKDLAAYPIVVPSSDIAAKLNEAIHPLLARMTDGVHRAQTLTQLRDTLLPRLISGQLRLPEAEVLIEEAYESEC